MTKQQIPLIKRFAIWIAYSKRCIYCREPIPFKHLWVDHVIPGHLASKPDRLSELLQEFGLRDNFEINDYGNWVASCITCNQTKGRAEFDHQAARYYVSIAQRNRPKAVDQEARIRRVLDSDKVLANLKLAVSDGLVSSDEVIAAIQQIPKLPAEYDHLVLCFGLNVIELVHEGQLPANAPPDYPSLCDWLESDLVSFLKSLGMGGFYYPEPSSRNGETLSVRLAFFNLTSETLDRFSHPWWELLEIEYYSDLYGEMPAHTAVKA